MACKIAAGGNFAVTKDLRVAKSLREIVFETPGAAKPLTVVATVADEDAAITTA